MDMPESVKAYFDAERRNDPDALVAAFAAGAAVRDEGAVHEGIPAIRSWWVAAKKKTHHVTAPIEMSGSGDKVSVCALVSGDFPNSPVTLDFAFTLEQGKIVELEIG
ncbi:nuclear transport factor 2 family protein [Ancylobacter pratisalsi]|uniref:Nuclear transport factor 2 family protein n=1 Tax=Ancylobacter pratisalsi TaxID=1745854 RepID=A0A6P1YKE6_9HYPH|nr:nuclear transport factor 2 family protein [Ancylobacter pratisalsi]QIB33161.1 nuclear transport factor 2 family protein [Ancylobacter pratisalsi]